MVPKSTLVLRAVARHGGPAQNGPRGQTNILQVRSERERVVQCIICEIGVTGRFTVAPPTGKDTK